MTAMSEPPETAATPAHVPWEARPILWCYWPDDRPQSLSVVILQETMSIRDAAAEAEKKWAHPFRVAKTTRSTFAATTHRRHVSWAKCRRIAKASADASVRHGARAVGHSGGLVIPTTARERAALAAFLIVTFAAAWLLIGALT